MSDEKTPETAKETQDWRPSVAPVRAVVTADSRPRLPRHVVLRHDPARDRWLILVPERVLIPEPTAVVLLQEADGKRTVSEIAAHLAQTYAADPAVIEADAIEMFQDMSDRGFLTLVAEG